MLGTVPKFPYIKATNVEDEEDNTEIEKHLSDITEMRKAFLQEEFKRKIKISETQSHDKYYDEIYVAGDEVFYQDGTDNHRTGFQF